MSSFRLNNVYLKSKYTVGAKMENEGPLKDYIDFFFKDNYCNEISYEKAEQRLNKTSINGVLKDVCLKDIGLFIGSDLLNQLSSSNYIMRDYNVPFIGTYSACASSGLNIIIASLFIEVKYYENILVFTSSHNNTAERQFRYPIEFGVQKKDTSTFTVTGSGSIVLSNIKNNIAVKNVTIGKVIDYELNDVNDFGSCMAIAAFDTFKRHFKELNLSYEYYDLVITGDLSNIGAKIFERLLIEEQIKIKEYLDSGLLIYNIEKQKVFSGGSGTACSMITIFSYVVKKMNEGIYKKVLVIPTGALLSNTVMNQKETIPSIAHAYSLEIV